TRRRRASPGVRSCPRRSLPQPPQDLVPRDHAELLQILPDLTTAELRRAELAVAERVRHLDDLLRLRARDHLEADLEADGVQVHAVERGAAYREESARGVVHRHENVAHEAREARDEAAAARTVRRRTNRVVAAADG